MNIYTYCNVDSSLLPLTKNKSYLSFGYRTHKILYPSTTYCICEFTISAVKIVPKILNSSVFYYLLYTPCCTCMCKAVETIHGSPSPVSPFKWSRLRDHKRWTNLLATFVYKCPITFVTVAATSNRVCVPVHHPSVIAYIIWHEGVCTVKNQYIQF